MHIEEGSLATRGNSFGEHSFAGAWRAEQEYTLPGLPDPCEVLRHQQRQKDAFLYDLLGIVECGNVVKRDVGVLVDDLSLEHLDEVGIWTISRGINAEEEL